jgi:hypothetical protein
VVRESVKNLSPEEQRIYMDLDTTEFLFKRAKTKKAKEAINRIRYLLIVQLHNFNNYSEEHL